jgi:tetratricopeptide (TPR) repeat protein
MPKTPKILPFKTLAIIGDYEETKNNRPKAATFANLLSGLNAAFADTKDAFVKQRYWFQLVRFYFNFDAPKAIQLFEQNQANFSKNTLYYRTMAYAAGAYYKQKNYAQANYYYSLVFDAGNNLKTVAHFSFHPQDEKDWQKTLSLCKNDNEKKPPFGKCWAFFMPTKPVLSTKFTK